ncbi:MAG TPA: hypothetical protein VMY77_03775 [Chitinophagaceae bacterium]|nr:hypothetical protein [Chitinophagaceae bacterium]
MKIITTILFILLTSCADGKTSYIGSTPANPTIKTFLGIPLSDPIDFIRWEFVNGGRQYAVICTYGISKPNTNGFIDPKKIDIRGKLTKEGNYYRLYHDNKTILLAIFNAHVLHFANADKSFMTGTGGWSYGLYSTGAALPSDIKPKLITLKDSMEFHGRTPCKEFSNQGLQVSPNCYKLKWSVVLYAAKGKPTTYKTRGTAFRNAEPKTGKWYFKNGMGWIDGGDHRLYFIMPGENIILFTDAKWNLLQGDLDFGYTLNRK